MCGRPLASDGLSGRPEAPLCASFSCAVAAGHGASTPWTKARYSWLPSRRISLAFDAGEAHSAKNSSLVLRSFSTGASAQRTLTPPPSVVHMATPAGSSRNVIEGRAPPYYVSVKHIHKTLFCAMRGPWHEHPGARSSFSPTRRKNISIGSANPKARLSATSSARKSCGDIMPARP